MPSNKFTSDVFLSYATEDLDDGVADIFMALYETGVTSAWLDRLVIKPGDSIPDKVDEGLRSTRYLVPVVSKTYFKKMWTRAELDAIRMLSKPAIPIWMGVSAKQVQDFSPILAAQKAILFRDDPYEVAEQVGNVLLENKRTHFFKNRIEREGSKAFWGACYFYVLAVLQKTEISSLSIFSGELANPDPTGATMLGNVEDAIDISHEEMRGKAEILRQRANDLGNQFQDEDAAHLICGEIKRRQAWFPHEPREHVALKKIGLDSF